MISCKHCATLNSLDSAFCKRCGTTLPEDEVQEARAKNDDIVAQGMTLFNDGKLGEAMAIAETAVLSDPSSTTALALKGMVHEREGRVADALECYERIVEMNPDSTLDKIKLTQLRNALVNHATAPANPRVAWIAALAACALVISVGALVAKMNTGGEVAKGEPVIQNSPLTFDAMQRSDQQNQQIANQQNPGQVNQPAGNQEPQPEQRQGEPTSGARDERDSGASRRGIGLPTLPRNSQLPVATEGDDPPSFDPGTTPVTVNPPSGTGLRVQPRDPDPNGDPDPDARGSRGTGETGPSPVAPPKPDNGIMEMRVSRGPSPKTPGGTRIEGNGVQALIRTANAQYEVGNHAQAASTYERALRAGGDPGSVNQRLGQAYDRMGRKGDAIAAYDRSIAALEAAIASGQGDPTRLKNALESAKQARKAAGGN
jgi:tetratricopeptide (TPR) repeat protein